MRLANIDDVTRGQSFPEPAIVFDGYGNMTQPRQSRITDPQDFIDMAPEQRRQIKKLHNPIEGLRPLDEIVTVFVSTGTTFIGRREGSHLNIQHYPK